MRMEGIEDSSGASPSEPLCDGKSVDGEVEVTVNGTEFKRERVTVTAENSTSVNRDDLQTSCMYYTVSRQLRTISSSLCAIRP